MANNDNFWWYITLRGPAGLEDVMYHQKLSLRSIFTPPAQKKSPETL